MHTGLCNPSDYSCIELPARSSTPYTQQFNAHARCDTWACSLCFIECTVIWQCSPATPLWTHSAASLPPHAPVLGHKVACDHVVQYCVPQKLQALVAGARRICTAAVCCSFCEQFWAFEVVLQPALELPVQDRTICVTV